MTTDAQPQSNQPEAPIGVPPATPTGRVQLARSQARAAFVYEAPAKPKAAEPAPDRDAKPDKMPAGEPEPDEGDDELADGAGDAKATLAPSAKPPADKAAEPDDDQPDPETSKRLAKVQAAEQRSREKLAAERKEHDAERAKVAKERAELDAERKELAEYRKARERAKVDPVAYLRAAGVTDPAELEYAARAVYAAGKGDPANKEAAARSMRERESDDRVAALEKRLEERDRRDEERQQAAANERRAAQYAEQIVKAAAASPLAKAALAKDPDGAHDDLSRIYVQLCNETGDAPDPEDVLARFERDERKRLSRYADPDSLLPTSPKKNSETAVKKPAAPTLGNDLSTPSVPRRTSDRANRAEMRHRFVEGEPG